MNSRDRDLIEHIPLAAKRLEETADDGRGCFEASWIARAAAERQLEIIGEAAGLRERQFQCVSGFFIRHLTSGGI